MSEFRNRAKAVLTGKGLYIALALCLIAGGTVAYLVYANKAPVQETTAITPVIEVAPKTVTPIAP